MGPLRIADFAGLDTWERIFHSLANDLDNSTSSTPAALQRLILSVTAQQPLESTPNNRESFATNALPLLLFLSTIARKTGNSRLPASHITAAS
eukprot:COSAG02_NODE_7755_length_2861_cov_51.173063_2_plen_93_part_00